MSRFTISSKYLQRSMHQLRKRVAVSQKFLTVGALRTEFRAWNRGWGNNFRMRVVQVEGGGYAGVLRAKKEVK